jgi:hypothetical protein
MSMRDALVRITGTIGKFLQRDSEMRACFKNMCSWPIKFHCRYGEAMPEIMRRPKVI